MEQVVSLCGDFGADLEGGKPFIEKNPSGETMPSGAKEEIRHLLPKPSYGLGSCNGMLQCEARVALSIPSSTYDSSLEHAKVVIDKTTMVGENKSSILEKKTTKEKPKAMSAKKPPKPPRPPRGLSLDSADQKLIKELAEIAKLKRARIERMKALKKMKETKASSSKNQLLATLFTILFCLVILFQGISSRASSAASSHGSSITSGVTRGGIISMVHYPNAHTSIANEPGSESPSLPEQSSGYPEGKVGQSVG